MALTAILALLELTEAVLVLSLFKSIFLEL